MTPDPSHFIPGSLEPFESQMETANGTTVPSYQCDTIWVIFRDVKVARTHTLTLHDVLFIPGLNNPLLSCLTFLDAGNTFQFLPHCIQMEIDVGWPHQVTIYGALPRPSRQAPHFPSSALAFTPYQGPPRPTLHLANPSTAVPSDSTTARTPHADSTRRTRVPMQVLHHRLGHRSSAALLAADQAKVWKDTQVLAEPDSFCTGCTITVSRTTKSGTQETEHNGKPGETLLLDIVDNPGRFGVTSDTHYKQYLLVVCAAS